MTRRERQICRAILTVLHDADGAQADEVSLHSEVNLIANCSLAEFEAALDLCDRNRWLTGVTSRYAPKALPGQHQQKKWNINDLGESARLEL